MVMTALLNDPQVTELYLSEEEQSELGRISSGNLLLIHGMFEVAQEKEGYLKKYFWNL